MWKYDAIGPQSGELFVFPPDGRDFLEKEVLLGEADSFSCSSHGKPPPEKAPAPEVHVEVEPLQCSAADTAPKPRTVVFGRSISNPTIARRNSMCVSDRLANA